MTQSEVPREGRRKWVRLYAGALSIGAFEVGRWWLRRTRAIYGF
jgi:hypothetical protein